MSAILKMLEGETSDNETLGLLAYHAIPSIQRLVSWVESAKHQYDCDSLEALKCTCGLDEIQSLLRS